jgi:hypothetical protein
MAMGRTPYREMNHKNWKQEKAGKAGCSTMPDMIQFSDDDSDKDFSSRPPVFKKKTMKS